MNQLYILLTNKILISAAFSFVIAEILKLMLNKDPKKYILGGGMPSAHTAMVVALTTAVYMQEGADTLFILTLMFAVIVVYNALGTRWLVGEEARTINDMLKVLKKDKKLKVRYLDVLRGHKPSEVFGGAAVGFIIALIVYSF